MDNVFHHLIEQLQQPICLLLLQLFIILVVSRLFALLFIKFKQAPVIGEIVAGLFLGVSVFGKFFPNAFSFLFPAHSFANLEVLSKIGLSLFMFIIGMELDPMELKRKAKSVVTIASASLFIPFLLGIGIAYFIYPSFQKPNSHFLPFSLFIGMAFGITAFPVLASILKARGLQKTTLGLLAISTAALIDAMAWCILAIIVVIAKAGNISAALVTICLAGLYIFSMFYVVRPFLQKLISRLRVAHYGDSNIIILSFIVWLFSAFIAEWIGIHMLFGAFLAGVVMPPNDSLRHTLISKFEDVSVRLLLPVFFVLSGLRLQLGLLHTPFLITITLVITLLAIIGKIFSTMLSARWTGHSWKEAISLAALMNTRGLMGAVILNIAYELGILSAELFAILMLMAILTTVLTCPLLDLIEYVTNRRQKE